MDSTCRCGMALVARFAVLVLAVSVVFPTPVCAQSTIAATYTLTDLGTLGGNTTYGNYAFAINKSGQITGVSVTSGAQQNAFVWANGVIQNLGTLGGAYSTGAAINSAGDVVGSSFPSGSTNQHAFFKPQVGQMLDLGTLGGPTSTATGVNDSNAVVGFSYTAGGGAGDRHAFLFPSQGSMQDLGTLGGASSEAYGINNNGQIIGDADLSDGTTHHAAIWTNGGVADLGVLGSYFDSENNGTVSLSYGYAINSSGAATGYSTTSAGAFHAYLYVLGSMIDLGTLGGASYGYAINDVGDVVGFSRTSSDMKNLTEHAFIAPVGGPMTDLNVLISAEDPLFSYVTLNWATAISNDGYILANGVDSRQGSGPGYNGGPKMYLLTPIDPLVALSSLLVTLVANLPNASPQQSVVLTNTGNSPLHISSISVTGTNSNEFQQTNDCESMIPPGDTCTLYITFVPDEDGDAKGDITITDDAPDSPQEIALGGSTGTPDYTLGAAPSQLSGNAGQALTTSVSVTPKNGFSQPVTFSCSGLPAGGSCTFAPASITPTIPAAAQTTLTIQTPATLSGSQSAGVAGMFGVPLLLSAGAFGLRRQRRLGRSVALWLLCGAMLAGCGGSSSSSSSSPTPPTTNSYNVVITATSGAGQSGSTVITHTLTLPLTLMQ